MRVFELLTVNKEYLNRLYAAGVRLQDCQYIELFDTYNEMVAAGEKVSYVVLHLAEKYGISERKVYGIVDKFSQKVTAE